MSKLKSNKTVSQVFKWRTKKQKALSYKDQEWETKKKISQQTRSSEITQIKNHRKEKDQEISFKSEKNP